MVKIRYINKNKIYENESYKDNQYSTNIKEIKNKAKIYLF